MQFFEIYFEIPCIFQAVFEFGQSIYNLLVAANLN